MRLHHAGTVIGQTIGHFKVVSHLGIGGMGEVWLAEQQSIGTRVAIKLLNASISKDTEHVQRFFNEARAVSRIQHVGIVKIFDVGQHAGQAYLIMEHLEGETLSQRLKRVGRLSFGQIGDIGNQIANVLDATHSVGIVHRDLKPDNVFLVPDRELGERVKILDFGIAKLTGTLADASPRTMGTMGTPAYMAPEQWGDTSKVDWRADLYSLGCLAFEMTCGRPPFVAENLAEACGKHLNEDAPPASSLAPTVPAKLERLLAQLLAKDPAARPASMREVARTFELLDKQALGAAPTLPAAAVSLPVPPRAEIKRSFSITPILLGVVALAMGAAGAIYFLRDSSPSRQVAEQPSVRNVAPRGDVAQAPHPTTGSVPSQPNPPPVSASTPPATPPAKRVSAATASAPSAKRVSAGTASVPPAMPRPAMPSTPPGTAAAIPPAVPPTTPPSAKPATAPAAPSVASPAAPSTTSSTTPPASPPAGQSPTRSMPTDAPRVSIDAGVPPASKDAAASPKSTSKRPHPNDSAPPHGSSDKTVDGSADADAPH